MEATPATWVRSTAGLINMPAEWSDSDDEADEQSATVYREACKEAGKVPCGKWLRACESRSDACGLQHYGIRAAGAVPRREAFGIFSHKINQAARRAGTDDKRREGKVPDLELDPFRRTGPDPVYQ